jgi:hypothetical protein
MALGIFLGPMAAKFLEVNKWGSPDPAQISEITLVCEKSTEKTRCNHI